MMNDWHAEVDVPYPDTPGEDALAAILRAMPTYAPVMHDADAGRLTVRFSVDATTLRQAAEQAIRTVREVTGRAPDGVRVITAERLREEIARPAAQELVGMVEAGEILGVSRQRVYELEQTHADFPHPIAELASGKIFTRASVEAFDQRWERKRTGRPPKA